MELSWLIGLLANIVECSTILSEEGDKSDVYFVLKMAKHSTIYTFLVITLFAESLTEPISIERKSSSLSNVDTVLDTTSPYHNIVDTVKSSIDKRMNDITEHLNLDEKLNLLSKKIVDAVISRMDAEDAITELTMEALKSVGAMKGTTVIETKRVLNYISRSLSGNISKYAKKVSPPHVERLIYGLAQSSSEIGIISGIDDDKWIDTLLNDQKVHGAIRNKRSPDLNDIPLDTKASDSIDKPNVISFTNQLSTQTDGVSDSFNETSPMPEVVLSGDNPLIEVLSSSVDNNATVFINQTTETEDEPLGNIESYIVENKINDNHIIKKRPTNENSVIDIYSNDDVFASETEANSGSLDDIMYQTADMYDEINYYQSNSGSSNSKENKTNHKLEKLENKARKALDYASDIAYFTAASFISMRRALTASMEVEVSLSHVQNGNYYYLLNDLAKSAAKQSGKEAKNSLSHVHACERAFKLAVKYTSQSRGTKSSYLAKRTLMHILPLVTLTKSLASISTNIAINSLVEANDVTNM